MHINCRQFVTKKCIRFHQIGSQI